MAESHRARQPVTEMIVDSLKADMREGLLSPGYHLIEQELAARFVVGRAPIREALRVLAAEGLATLEPNRGARVRMLSREDVRQTYELRELLEGLAARRTTENLVDPSLRAAFTHLVETMERTATERDVPRYIGLNTRFHRFFFDNAANDQLRQMADRLATPLVRFQFGIMMTPEALAASHAHHREIADGVLSGKPERAEAAMRQHIRASLEQVSALEDRYFSPG